MAKRLQVGVLGMIVATITAILGIYKSPENCPAYRTPADGSSTRSIFFTNPRPYDKQDPFKLLVERFEGLIYKENTSWLTHLIEEKKKNG
jgi:hypothetical protein